MKNYFVDYFLIYDFLFCFIFNSLQTIKDENKKGINRTQLTHEFKGISIAKFLLGQRNKLSSFNGTETVVCRVRRRFEGDQLGCL